jgi:hypothetical protein
MRIAVIGATGMIGSRVVAGGDPAAFATTLVQTGPRSQDHPPRRRRCAGSLVTESGVRLVDTPELPEVYRPVRAGYRYVHSPESSRAQRLEGDAARERHPCLRSLPSAAGDGTVATGPATGQLTTTIPSNLAAE